MKIPAGLVVIAAVAGGFYLVSNGYAQSPAASGVVPIRLEPIVHAKFDKDAIARNIAFHEGRVKRDSKGPIGWSMLADAYLAESREYDSDRSAWKAEAAARKSLSLRTRGNERAKGALIAALLEQHRFQDALKTLDAFEVKKGRLRADVIIELGRYKEAERLLSVVNPEDPSRYAGLARIAMLSHRPKDAVRLLTQGRKMVGENAGIGDTTLAWYDIKLGDALVAMGDKKQARSRYDLAIREHPRSYKGHLALARLNFAEKKWDQAIMEGQATMKIANSLDARSVIGDAYAASGNVAEANKWFASCREQYLEEVATFDRLGRGGPFHVRPIDRQFAHFAATHRRYSREAIVAAKRDLMNRPDPQAHETLAMLKGETLR